MLNSYNRARILLGIATAVCFAIFYLAGKYFSFPEFPQHAGSIMVQPAPAADLVLIAIVLPVCVLLGTLIAGTIRFDAGLFAASIGLTALSARSGAIREVLFQDGRVDIFLVLVEELLILYAIIAAAWVVLWMLHKRELLKPDAYRDGVADTDHSVAIKIMALLIQIITMGIALMFFAQSQEKAQMLLGVSLSAFLGAIASHTIVPVRPSPWFFMGPLVVGIVGYVWEYASPGTWQIGHVMQPLARPLPLDYASAGTAGAIFGYWSSRRWHRARLAEAKAAGEEV